MSKQSRRASRRDRPGRQKRQVPSLKKNRGKGLLIAVVSVLAVVLLVMLWPRPDDDARSEMENVVEPETTIPKNSMADPVIYERANWSLDDWAPAPEVGIRPDIPPPPEIPWLLPKVITDWHFHNDPLVQAAVEMRAEYLMENHPDPDVQKFRELRDRNQVGTQYIWGQTVNGTLFWRPIESGRQYWLGLDTYVLLEMDTLEEALGYMCVITHEIVHYRQLLEAPAKLTVSWQDNYQGPRTEEMCLFLWQAEMEANRVGCEQAAEWNVISSHDELQCSQISDDAKFKQALLISYFNSAYEGNKDLLSCMYVYAKEAGHPDPEVFREIGYAPEN